jgi:predicted aminopeptidase
MSVLNKSASRHYALTDKWLDDNSGTESKYYDILDTKEGSNAEVATADVVRAQQKADFYATGIIVQTAGFVQGFLMEETTNDVDTYYLAAGVVHPLRFRRIYANGTTARGVKWIGYKRNA